MHRPSSLLKFHVQPDAPQPGAEPTPSAGHRRRSSERGITVFVVMLAIVMLTGAGTWAMYSAGLTDQASGYARASAQALYTAELGLLAGSAYLSVPGYADSNFEVATKSLATGPRDACISASDTTDFCKSISMSNLDSTFATETTANGGVAYSLMDQASAQGSLSPFDPTDAAFIEGDFLLEMTEPRPVTLPGEATQAGLYQRVTLTAFGRVRPALGSSSFCTGSRANNAAATMMGMRAHMVVGPLPSQAGR